MWSAVGWCRVGNPAVGASQKIMSLDKHLQAEALPRTFGKDFGSPGSGATFL